MSKLIVGVAAKTTGMFLVNVYLNVPFIDILQTTDFIDAATAILLNCGFLNAIFAILII